MDFHSMKRKDLQRMCKKHGIQANLKNAEMADRLSYLFKEENSRKRGSSCLKSDEEEVIGSKESKRVKFSLENETFWFQKTDPREMRLMDRKKRGFQNSEIEQNPVSVVEEVVQNDYILGKAFERKLRSRSAVVKCGQISDSESVYDLVEKSVISERKLKRSDVVKCDQISVLKSVDDHVENPVRRSSRRKSLAVKSDEISEPKTVDDDDDFEKPVSRNMRRKSVVVEADHTLESKMNGDKVEKPAQRTRRKSVLVESDHISESKKNGDKVEKLVQRTRRKSVVVEGDHISESRMNDEKIEKPVLRTRRKSVTVKSDPSSELGIVVNKVEKPVQKASRRKSVVVKSDHKLDSKHVVDKVEKPAVRASRRRSVVVKSDQNLDSKTDEVERDSRRSFVNSNIAVENNVQVESSDIAPDIKKGKRRRTTKITRKQAVKRDRKAVAEGLMEENVDDEPAIIDKAHDDAVADVQSNVSPMLHYCVNGEAESSMQANKVDESSSLNIVADKNSYEEDATTPPSLHRIQFSDTLAGSTTEHTVGELMCQSTTKPSLLESCAVGDAGGEQPSGPLGEIRSAMRDRETFGRIDVECHQSRNKQLVQQESWFEKSPCLGSSPENENAVENKRIDCAAVIVVESDVRTTEQDEATGLWGSCESIIREVDQKCEFSLNQQLSHFASEEKVVLVPESNMETKVQTPIVEGVILSANASGSTQNNVLEERNDINTSTLLWKQDVVSQSSDAEDSPVVQSLNKDDDVVDSLKSKASECVSVSGETKYLEQSSVDAEDMKCNVSGSNSNAAYGNFEDRGTPEASHPVNTLLHLDVGNTRIGPPKHNDSAEETITVADKPDTRLKYDDKFAELKLIPQVDIIHQVETRGDNYCAQSCELTVVSGSVAEGRPKDTPSTDLTCLSNDKNGENVDGKAKYVAAKQPEEANCFDELEFQHMVSGDDITNDAQSEDLEFKRVMWTTEDLLALGGEVEESVMSQERKSAGLESERNTLHYDVYGSRNVSDQSKDFKHKTVKDDDDAKNPVVDTVIILQVQDDELAKTSNLKNGTSSGGCISSSNTVSENSPIKEMVNPVSEFGVHFKDDETSAHLKSNSCNIPVELIEIETPKVFHAQDSSLDSSQEKANLKIEIAKFVDSIEDKVKSRPHETGNVEEAEGMGTQGSGNPQSMIGDMLDEALAHGSGQQAKSVDSVEKEFVYISQQAAGYIEGGTEVVNSAESGSVKSNSERVVGEEVEMELAMQNNILATVSESSKRDGGDDILMECSMVDTGLKHSVEQGKHFDSCGSPFEMADKSGSPMRDSGNFSLRKVASGSDNDAGSLMVDYPSFMDTKSTCYSADVYAPTCNETLLNACIGDVDGLHSGEPIPSEDNQDDIGNCMSGEQVNNQDHMDPIHTDASVIRMDHSTVNCCGSLEISPKHNESRSPACNDHAQELDFVKSPDVGLSQDNRDVTALSNLMEEDAKLAEEHFCGPSERRIERESSDIDTSDNITATDFSLPSICQPGKFITALLANEGLKSNVVFTDAEIDYLFCGDWETEKVEVRELQSGTSNSACSVNEYEIPDVEHGAVSTHQPANEMILEPENLASGEQEPGNSESEARGYDEVLMSSVIQRKNLKNDAEFEGVKSDIIFTDSEIDLLLGETTKDGVREFQTKASDDVCLVAVSEYETADVETDMVNTHQLAVEKFLEPQNLVLEDHNPLGDDDKEKSDVTVDPVRDVQNCIDDKAIQRKNERSILIHGTPKKLHIFMNDMKENTPAPKRQQMVDVTAAKPSLRRKALQKIN